MPDTLSPQVRFGSNSGQPVTRRDGIAKVTASVHADGYKESSSARCALSLHAGLRTWSSMAARSPGSNQPRPLALKR